MLVAAVTVDSGAEYSHDFHQVGTETFHRRLVGFIIKNGDSNPEELANLKNDLTAKAQQSILVGEN
jgi:hypothetical protein